MEELNAIRERLKNNRLSFTWLIFQLDSKGIKTDKTEVSLIFAGTRTGAKAESIIQEAKVILDNYENAFVKD